MVVGLVHIKRTITSLRQSLLPPGLCATLGSGRHYLYNAAHVTLKERGKCNPLCRVMCADPGGAEGEMKVSAVRRLVITNSRRCVIFSTALLVLRGIAYSGDRCLFTRALPRSGHEVRARLCTEGLGA
ncbi:hypothetical protein E2C01_051946 [Portunus trituberculatus]|uniref:Uncharacterized protein n=1 Tax=Portunus trituberculatus TaxID=210409 RepID=A0A5B7GN31_PORTR|nr:hypothetical protein [Portunus trituberculatus]